jgi:hypothetical protein
MGGHNPGGHNPGIAVHGYPEVFMCTLHGREYNMPERKIKSKCPTSPVRYLPLIFSPSIIRVGAP